MTAWPNYITAIETALGRGDATEHTHRPALKALVESVGRTLLSVPVTAVNEPRRVECGAPDFTVSKKLENNPFNIGYIETKDVGVSLDQAEKSEQLKRYRRSLGNLLLTDYLEFRWYVDGDLRMSARLARLTKEGKVKSTKEDREKVEQLFTAFFHHEPEPISRPKDLAVRLARIAHIIREIIIDSFDTGNEGPLIKNVRMIFK